ncbi:MAG: hypothetical protein M1830_005545 [Pleopsidium flavum]|nr:MAG: hypothetical protein M1830_005545 [Pleopsidium flavum]
MSAAAGDRNSPPPGAQTELQQGAVGSGNASENKKEESTQEQSKKEESNLGGLESNPTGPVETQAKEKVGKN